MSSSPCLLGIGEARLGPIPCNELRHAGCMLKSAREQALQALIHVERFCEQLPDNLGEYTATQSAEIQQLTDRVSELELDKDVLEQENHALKEQIEMLKAQVAERRVMSLYFSQLLHSYSGSMCCPHRLADLYSLLALICCTLLFEAFLVFVCCFLALDCLCAAVVCIHMLIVACSSPLFCSSLLFAFCFAYSSGASYFNMFSYSDRYAGTGTPMLCGGVLYTRIA